eukprot:CAMPEP_0114682498 /NCGR_PEP_ID=MMETSP0191-20121206/56623_1 /TAXON_ID=126664 /ORGANISM="Sorites sp." /LENGTH=99 /DNA_ID=CAMNT_0001962211 /DNA_START=28 /DNA_END=327 /DNA_ORIENTATION=+
MAQLQSLLRVKQLGIPHTCWGQRQIMSDNPIWVVVDISRMVLAHLQLQFMQVPSVDVCTPLALAQRPCPQPGRPLASPEPASGPSLRHSVLATAWDPRS